MTATLEAMAPVVMVTADGETRPADMWGRDSYTCKFCDSPVYGPVDWAEHERSNMEHYAIRGETYNAEPYSYRARYWGARECANPMCLSALTGERLERVREDQRRRTERDARDAAEKAREQAKRDAQAAREAAKGDLIASVRPTALQLGFAWACCHTEPAESYGADPVMCEASGWDRGEYDAHMRGHGAKAYHGVKLPKLRRKPPAASLPKLPCDPLNDTLTWAETHREPGVCPCGHGYGAHRAGRDYTYHPPRETVPGCEACTCQADKFTIQAVVTEATRAGQFWGNGPRPHTIWALPREPAPWETGPAAPVVLSVKDGRIEWAGWNHDPNGAVRRAENVRARGVFAVISSHNGPLRGYYRSTVHTVHTSPECARADGWPDARHQPYDVWTVVDILTGRQQGNGDTLCPRCVMLEPAEDETSKTA